MTAVAFRPASWKRPLDWLPTLSAYIAAVPGDRDAALYLDARDAGLDPEVVRNAVMQACAYIAGESDFAEIVLVEGETEVPAAAAPVAGAGELLERFGIRPPAQPEQPHAIVEHARWAKALADAIQSDVDRALIAAVPPVVPSMGSLVTVRIPTFGSTDLLVERAIPSVLNGAYGNIELLVCSDGPQPHARAAVEGVDDPRVRYIEIEERPVYPSQPNGFWQTAGTYAVNRLVEESRGDFIAPLDHDDAFTFDHIPQLLAGLQQGPADFAYGQALNEMPTGPWTVLGSAPLAHGRIVHATVMYSRRLAHMRYDPHAWLLDEPGDWNMWRRMRDASASIVHVPAPVAVHFKERSSIGGRAVDPRPAVEGIAADVLGTSARELLDVARPLAAPSQVAGLAAETV